MRRVGQPRGVPWGTEGPWARGEWHPSHQGIKHRPSVTGPHLTSRRGDKQRRHRLLKWPPWAECFTTDSSIHHVSRHGPQSLPGPVLVWSRSCVPLPIFVPPENKMSYSCASRPPVVRSGAPACCCFNEFCAPTNNVSTAKENNPGNKCSAVYIFAMNANGLAPRCSDTVAWPGGHL